MKEIILQILKDNVLEWDNPNGGYKQYIDGKVDNLERISAEIEKKLAEYGIGINIY